MRYIVIVGPQVPKLSEWLLVNFLVLFNHMFTYMLLEGTG